MFRVTYWGVKGLKAKAGFVDFNDSRRRLT